MVPIRHVTFLDDKGKPLRTVPSHLTPVEEEVQGEAAEQDAMVEFDESSAPAPAQASVHHTILPAPVGAARELMSLRRSNVLNDPPLRRRRRRAAKRRSRSGSRSRTASRPKRRSAARPSRSSRSRRPVSRSSRGSRTTTRTTRRTVRRTTVSRRR
jgi:hypothetical protein